MTRVTRKAVTTGQRRLDRAPQLDEPGEALERCDSIGVDMPAGGKDCVARRHHLSNEQLPERVRLGSRRLIHIIAAWRHVAHAPTW